MSDEIVETKAFPYCVSGPEQDLNFSPKVEQVFSQPQPRWGPMYFLLKDLEPSKDADPHPKQTHSKKVTHWDMPGIPAGYDSTLLPIAHKSFVRD
jgi:hypothetical protein